MEFVLDLVDPAERQLDQRQEARDVLQDLHVPLKIHLREVPPEPIHIALPSVALTP